MKLMVFGAAGAVGRHIVAEALARGHAVTAAYRATRRPDTLAPGADGLRLDVETAPDLHRVVAEHDLALSALRPPDGQEDALVPLTHRILTAARRAGRRVIVSGGAACLRLGNGSAHTVLGAPGFLPDHVVPIARACQAQFDLCLADTETDWTYACPPPMLTDAPRTGRYRRGTDTVIQGADGLSQIGMADWAVALLDEAENPGPPRDRFTAAC